MSDAAPLLAQVTQQSRNSARRTSGQVGALARAADAAPVCQRLSALQRAADTGAPGRRVLQRYEMKVFESGEIERFAAARSEQWPDGIDAMVAWAASIKQVRTLVNSFTADEFAEIQQLFPGGMVQAKKSAIESAIAKRKDEIYKATPLDGTTLKPFALAERTLIMQATDLTNQTTRTILTGIDADLSHWGKYRTNMYDSGIGNRDKDYSVHFYYNSDTQEVCETRDYKKKFRDQTQEYIN